MAITIFTVEDCTKCEYLKCKLNGEYTEYDGAALFGCNDWGWLVNIRAELAMKNWDKEYPVIVDGSIVYTFEEYCSVNGWDDYMEGCSNGACKLAL